MNSKQNKTKQDSLFKINDYEFNSTDKKVFDLSQTYPQLKQGEIGKLLGINRTRVSTIMNKPAFKNAVDKFSMDALEVIQKSKTAASIELIDLALKAKSELVRLQSCKAILSNELMPKEDGGLDDTYMEALRKLAVETMQKHI